MPTNNLCNFGRNSTRDQNLSKKMTGKGGKIQRNALSEDWINSLKKLEDECTYRLMEDIDRIKGAVDPRHIDYVLKTLKLKEKTMSASEISSPQLEEEESSEQYLKSSNISLGSGISSPVVMKEESGKTVSESGLQKIQETSKDASFVESSHKSLIEPGEPERNEDEIFRRTICDTIYQKIQAKAEPSPYRIELSIEGSAIVAMEDESSGSFIDSEKPSYEFHQSAGVTDDLIVHPPSMRKKSKKDILEDPRSPYQKFFSRSKNEIHEHLDRNIKQQVHTEKDKLFQDFIQFLDLPDIQLKSENISLESLRKLFDIRIQNQAADSFAADVTELPKIPKGVSELYDDIQSSGRASLHRQIIWDIVYEEGRERKVAFGRSLPKPRLAWKNDTRKKWLISDDIPWDLVSGRDLWKDLLNTEILQSFAQWLVANPQYERPKYLEKIGYFNNLPEDAGGDDPVSLSLKKKRCGEAFYALANNMKYFVGDNELSYLPRLGELKSVMESSNQPPGNQ